MDSLLYLEFLIFAVLMAFSAFFSSSETSLFSLTVRQLDQMERDGNRRISLIRHLLNEPRRLIITILIGNELVNVSASVISAAIVIDLLGADNKWVNLLIMIPLLLLVGEITPKSLAIRNNVGFAAFQSRPIRAFAWLIAPLRVVVRRIADGFITLLVGRERSRGNIITEDMVRTLADEAVGEGALDHQEAQYISQIFDFGNKTVEELITPRAGIFYLSSSLPPEQMVAELRRTRFTKVPIYRKTRDNIVGVLYARDLLGLDLEELYGKPQELRRILRQPYFVPETKSAEDLFHDFRRMKLSLAFSVDEYGGVTGLVTMEDLLECIFGDIYSASETREEDPFEKLAEGRFRVSGVTPVAEFNPWASTSLSEELAETVGGHVLHEHGELPSSGTEIRLEGLRFKVTRVGSNRIEELEVERDQPAPGSQTPDGSVPHLSPSGDVPHLPPSGGTPEEETDVS